VSEVESNAMAPHANRRYRATKEWKKDCGGRPSVVGASASFGTLIADQLGAYTQSGTPGSRATTALALQGQAELAQQAARLHPACPLRQSTQSGMPFQGPFQGEDGGLGWGLAP